MSNRSKFFDSSAKSTPVTRRTSSIEIPASRFKMLNHGARNPEQYSMKEINISLKLNLYQYNRVPCATNLDINPIFLSRACCLFDSLSKISSTVTSSPSSSLNEPSITEKFVLSRRILFIAQSRETSLLPVAVESVLEIFRFAFLRLERPFGSSFSIVLLLDKFSTICFFQ